MIQVAFCLAISIYEDGDYKVIGTANESICLPIDARSAINMEILNESVYKQALEDFKNKKNKSSGEE